VVAELSFIQLPRSVGRLDRCGTRCDRGVFGAPKQNSGDAEIAQGNSRRLGDADGFAVHEAEERQQLASHGEARNSAAFVRSRPTSLPMVT
jgi:hypothetical protein